MEYQTIFTIKESEKATVELAALEGQTGPVIIKKLRGVNPDIYRLLCCVQNLHIPKIYAYEQQDNELMVAEEYVDGENLEEYVQNHRPGDKEKLQFALQLCEAVKFLHSMEPPIIHRDIKPSNILITGKGILKLIDFDASRQYKVLQNSGDTRLLGTVEYAPPEQFGYSQTDMRSDIYSMGVVFHEIELTENEKLQMLWSGIVEKCTSFDPKNRYQSVQELEKEIEKLIHWEDARKKRLVMWLCGIAVAVAVMLCGAGVMWKQVQNRETAVNKEVTVSLEPTPSPAVILSPELEVTATPEPTPTITPEPTAIPTPTPIVELPPIEYTYYKSYLMDFAVINESYKEYEAFDYATCYCFQTGEIFDIPTEMLELFDGYIRVSELFMLSLEPDVYKFSFYYKGKFIGSNVYDTTVEVFSGAVEVVPAENKLVKSEKTIYSECPGNISNAVRNGESCKIKHAYFFNQNGEKVVLQQNWYGTDFYSWVITVKGEFLLPYFTQGMLKLYIELDDGTMEEMDITLEQGVPPIPTYYLEKESIQKYALPYYLPHSGESDMIFSHNMEKLELTGAQCYCNSTGQTLEIPLDMVETDVGYICVSREYMKTLEPLAYKFIFKDTYGIQLSSWVMVQESNGNATKGQLERSRFFSLPGQYYTFMPGIGAILCQEFSGRITGVLLKSQDGTEVPLKSEWYNIACDGRYILVKKDFFMQYSIGEMVRLIFTFDDGGKHQAEIFVLEK